MIRFGIRGSHPQPCHYSSGLAPRLDVPGTEGGVELLADDDWDARCRQGSVMSYLKHDLMIFWWFQLSCWCFGLKTTSWYLWRFKASSPTGRPSLKVRCAAQRSHEGSLAAPVLERCGILPITADLESRHGHMGPWYPKSAFHDGRGQNRDVWAPIFTAGCLMRFAESLNCCSLCLAPGKDHCSHYNTYCKLLIRKLSPLEALVKTMCLETPEPNVFPGSDILCKFASNHLEEIWFTLFGCNQ